MTNLKTKIKWSIIYLVGAIIGLFIGANTPLVNVGEYIYNHTHSSPAYELDELLVLFYGGLVGMLLSIGSITLVRMKLDRGSGRK